MEKTKKASLKALKKIFQKEGLRLTGQRISIWNHIQMTKKKHTDVEEIFLSMRKKTKNVSRATIYRTLDVFVKNKLLSKMNVGKGYSLYETKLENEHHDHMICEDTGKIIEFFSEEIELLQDQIAKDHGYKVVRHIHQLYVKKLN